MIWHRYKLDNSVLKMNEPLTLWKTDRGSVEIGKDAMAVAVTLEGRPQGYVIRGNGKMLLDAIVETEQGAIGKPVEQELAEPFLMLGNTQLIESRSSLEAGGEQKDFLTKAEDLCHKFFKEREHLGPSCHDHNEGLIFAFKNDSDNFDVLIPHRSRIVYRSKRMVFISDEDRTIMRNPEHTVVSNNGRCIIVKGRGQKAHGCSFEIGHSP